MNNLVINNGMVLKIPGTKKYMDIDTMKIYLDSKKQKELKTKNGYISLELNGYPVSKSLEWFKHLTMLGLEMPEGYEEAINNIIFKDYKPFGISTDYYKIPIFKTPVEFKIDGINMRIISRFPNYAISDDGKQLYSFIRKKMIMLYCYKQYSYISTSLKDTVYFRTHTHTGVHRLVAIAWVPNDDYVKNNIIDHKDNNKANNHKDNLVWTSNRSNQAKRKHDSTDYVVIVRNIETGKVDKYHSLNEASKAIGRTNIDNNFTPLEYGKVWKTKLGQYEIYFTKDFKGWKYNNINDIPTYTISTVTPDGEEYFFKNLKELKTHHGLPQRLDSVREIAERFKKLGIKDTINIYKNKRINRVVEAKNIKTGEIIKGSSAYDIHKKTGATLSTVNKYVKNNIDNRLIGDWLVRYESNKPWADELNNIEEPINKGVKVKITSEDGQEEIFDSVAKAGKYFNIDRKTLMLRIEKNEPYIHNNKIYHIQYI